MFLSKKIAGLCVAAFAFVGNLAAAPAEASTTRHPNTVIVLRKVMPRAAVTVRVIPKHVHVTKGKCDHCHHRFHDRRDFRRHDHRRIEHRRDFRRGHR
jgi:hypothetical protein